MPIKKVQEKGSVIAGFVLCLPIAIGFIVMILIVGLVIFERTKLQSAVDMAAYAGAASLANSLNEIAVKNKNVRAEFLSLKKDLGDDSQQNKKAATERYEKYARAVQDNLHEMNELLLQMPDRARLIASNNFKNNSSANISVNIVGNVELRKDDGFEVEYVEIEGPLFVDPDSFASGSFLTLKNIFKLKSPPPSISINANKRIKVPALAGVAREFVVAASAQALAFGGNLFGYASEGEVEIPDDVRTWDALYSPALSEINVR